MKESPDNEFLLSLLRAAREQVEAGIPPPEGTGGPFAHLVELVQPLLLANARRRLNKKWQSYAEDVVQMTFLKLWKNILKTNRIKFVLPNLFLLQFQVIQDHFVQKKWPDRLVLDEITHWGHLDTAVEERDLLEIARGEMVARQRSVFDLYHSQPISRTELIARVGGSAASVDLLLHRAHAKFRDRLEKSRRDV